MNKYMAVALASFVVAGAYTLPAVAQFQCEDQCSMQLASCDEQMYKKLPGMANDNNTPPIFAQCRQAESGCFARCGGGQPNRLYQPQR